MNDLELKDSVFLMKRINSKFNYTEEEWVKELYNLKNNINLEKNNIIKNKEKIHINDKKIDSLEKKLS